VPHGYGYGNARLRAMRSRLLTQETYSDLLARENIGEVISRLSETPYKDDVEVALVRVDGVNCIFEAVRTNLTRTLRHVREFFEAEPRALVDILLRRWDRHNLVTVLRGQSQAVSPETVLSAVVPVGQLDEVSLRELARQPGLRAVMDLMTTWGLPYADVLRGVRARTGATPDLDQFELALNRFHYASMQEALGGKNSNRALLREYLRTEIDILNISTALRLARIPDLDQLLRLRYGMNDLHALLIEPGGDIRIEWLDKLVAEGIGMEGIVRGLSNSRYGNALESGWKRYQAGEGDVTVLERELERWQAHYTATMFTRDPLSIAVCIGYFGCKGVEVANLRLIAEAVALNMKREQVRRDLIIV